MIRLISLVKSFAPTPKKPVDKPAKDMYIKEYMGDTFDNNQPDLDTYGSVPNPVKNELDQGAVRKIYEKLGYDFDFKEFQRGMEVELEHKDVTEGDPIKTAKIAAAHLREVPNYYTLLKQYVEK